jgi:hypothetical protein
MEPMEIFHDAHPFSQIEDELLVEGGGGEVLWTSAQLVAELRSVGRPRRRDVIVGGAGARSARTVSF